MPEGHTVHRTANQFAKHFHGQALTVDSPQGRFAPGAALLSAHTVTKALAVGKQMFIYFDHGLVLRIHLGIYGKYRWYEKPELIREHLTKPVVGEVRARFYNEFALAELRGPTVCEVLSLEEVDSVFARLGPDPLNPDPKGLEAERFMAKVSKSQTPIGLLLMNQAVISGIGNVYRAEILFRANIDPYRPGRTLTREQLQAIWEDSVALLKVGVETGFMITRDELTKKRPSKEERNFVYKREGKPCRVCGTKVSLAIASTRKLYWCATCQK